jgi:hypothetical protein
VSKRGFAALALSAVFVSPALIHLFETRANKNPTQSTHMIDANMSTHRFQRAVSSGVALERVINFSTLSAMIYGRPLPLRDLVNFLDGTKSLSK